MQTRRGRQNRIAGQARAFFTLGIYLLVVSPALYYASRLDEGLHTAALGLSIAFFVGGVLAVTTAILLGKFQLPLKSVYLLTCALLLCVGTFMLAFLRDLTIFLATFMGALAGIVIPKLEELTTSMWAGNRRPSKKKRRGGPTFLFRADLNPSGEGKKLG